MKTIYLFFLILLIVCPASSAYLHAGSYPSESTTNNNVEAEQNDNNQQEKKQIQTPYPDHNNQVATHPAPPMTTTQLNYNDAQTQYAAMQAANNALTERAKMRHNSRRTNPPQQPNIPSTMVMPQLPQFVQNMQRPDPRINESRNLLSLPALNIDMNSPHNQNIQTQNTPPPSNEKCHVVCGQYSNYTYATLISSIAQSSSVMVNGIMQKVTKFTAGQIQNKAQCTAEALTPHLSGKNTLYSNARFYPGMPRPQLFYRICKKQCLSGTDGVIFKKSNPVIIEFMRQYDFTHGKKDDKTLALIAASGNGGFEDDTPQATPNGKKKQKFYQAGAQIVPKRGG